MQYLSKLFSSYKIINYITFVLLLCFSFILGSVVNKKGVEKNLDNKLTITPIPQDYPVTMNYSTLFDQTNNQMKFFITSPKLQGVMGNYVVHKYPQGGEIYRMFYTDLSQLFMNGYPGINIENPNDYAPKFTFYLYSYNMSTPMWPNGDRVFSIEYSNQLLFSDSLMSVKNKLPILTASEFFSITQLLCVNEQTILFTTKGGGFLEINWLPSCLALNGFDSRPKILATVYFDNPYYEMEWNTNKNAVQLLVNIPSYLDMDLGFSDRFQADKEGEYKYKQLLKSYIFASVEFLNSIVVKN